MLASLFAVILEFRAHRKVGKNDPNPLSLHFDDTRIGSEPNASSHKLPNPRPHRLPNKEAPKPLIHLHDTAPKKRHGVWRKQKSALCTFSRRNTIIVAVAGSTDGRLLVCLLPLLLLLYKISFVRSVQKQKEPGKKKRIRKKHMT